MSGIQDGWSTRQELRAAPVRKRPITRIEHVRKRRIQNGLIEKRSAPNRGRFLTVAALGGAALVTGARRKPRPAGLEATSHRIAKEPKPPGGGRVPHRAADVMRSPKRTADRRIAIT